MGRPRDAVRVESVDNDAGSFDRFTSAEITNDLTAPAEASFECGNDGTYPSFEKILQFGNVFRVFVNDRLRCTGRIEAHDVPTDATGGATVRFVIRTKLADAAYASASPIIAIQGATLKQVILLAYASLGFDEDDFVFKTDVARDLMTGKSSKASSSEVDLEPIKLEQAKVSPPETIYEFVERHLLRFHLSHWDSPDGKIVVGAPDDTQAPRYFFRLNFGPRGAFNNVLRAQRIRDISESPSLLAVYGAGGKTDFVRTKVAWALNVPEVAESKLWRPVFIVDESIRSTKQAESRAKRELAARTRKLDSWEIETDGWSWWDGRTLIPYGIDTVADVDIATAGGSTGSYLLHRTRLRLDPEIGFTSHLTLVRKGLWVL